MADAKDPKAAPGGAAKPDDKGKDGGKGIEVVSLVGFNKIKTPAAQAFVKVIPHWARRFIITYDYLITGVAALVSYLTPSKGLWIITDYQMDFAQEVIRVCKERENMTDGEKVAEAEKPFDETAQARRVQVAVATINDQAKRDQFQHWYNKLSPADRTAFHFLAAQAKDNELKDIIQLPASELTAVIQIVPAPKPPSKKLTQLQLRDLIRNMPGLQQEVDKFITSKGLSAQFFWNHIEKMLGNDLDEFQRLMGLPEDERAVFLGMDPKGRKAADFVQEWKLTLLGALKQLTTPTTGKFDLFDIPDAAREMEAAVRDSGAMKRVDAHSIAFEDKWQKKLAERQARKQKP